MWNLALTTSFYSRLRSECTKKAWVDRVLAAQLPAHRVLVLCSSRQAWGDILTTGVVRKEFMHDDINLWLRKPWPARSLLNIMALKQE